MDFLQRTFEQTKRENRAAIIGYITAGDPCPDESLKIIDTACESGIDILELGIPFSDPTADGVIIQQASGRAIKAGMTLAKGIDFVRELRKKHSLPIILFSYFNPIFVFGIEKFLRNAIDAGVDGALIVDLPTDNADEITQPLENITKNQKISRGQFHLIRLIAPTTDTTRRQNILRNADGFIYVISRRGVTGGNSNKIDWNKLDNEIKSMRKETNAPLCVGFGISNQQDVNAAGKIADGVIIGSAIQKIIETNPKNTNQAVASFIRNLRSI
ncbi:MAG: tryptophan synthase subunit alpha [Planctomycetaceae bacterium]|jgi:tryptophan synthase alpha chain|nr:tryptophan synthase subunit alpha [Planctomycetaceae bacterium]